MDKQEKLLTELLKTTKSIEKELKRQNRNVNLKVGNGDKEYTQFADDVLEVESHGNDFKVK